MNSVVDTGWNRFGSPFLGEEYSLHYTYYAGEDEVVERIDPTDEAALRDFQMIEGDSTR